MKMMAWLVLVGVLSLFAMAGDFGEDEFLVKPDTVGAKEEGAKASVTQDSDKTADEAKKNVGTRKCYKCLGRGTVVVSTYERCEKCEGAGTVVLGVELDDTVHDSWGWKSTVKRKSINRQPCPRCNRRGKLSVKKNVECSVCKGSGLLMKNGRPYLAETKNVAITPKDETSTMSLAERIRSKSKGEVVSESGSGRIKFNPRGNDGRFVFKCKDVEFITRWSTCSAESVYAYKNEDGDLIGFKTDQKEMPSDKSMFETFDWTMRSVRLHKGNILAYMDSKGNFLCIRLLDVGRRGRSGDAVDEVDVEFKLY